MQAHGGDRFRISGEKVVLYSRISKGWTVGTHVCPGTAVQWEEQFFEVMSAEPLPAGGVRYVLAPWSESSTMRTFSIYDEASEERLRADDELAQRQRKNSRIARLSGVFLGHLPAHVQNHYANELGLFPARMTLLSTIPSMVLLGTCVWLYAGSRLEERPSPVPAWLFAFALLMLADSAVRFLVAMSQMRGMGSFPGTIGYALYRLVARKPEPRKLSSSFTLPATEEVTAHDSLEMRDAFLTLLRPDEQTRIAERFGWDYRRYASRVAWAILLCAAIGAASMTQKLLREGGLSPLLSLVCALLVVVEQIARLNAFRRGPAGSVFGLLVRPFARDLLERS